MGRSLLTLEDIKSHCLGFSVMSGTYEAPIVRVKQEFIVVSETAQQGETLGAANSEDFEGKQSEDPRDKGERSEDPRDNQETDGKGGKNKKKRARDDRGPMADKLCTTFAADGYCSYGDSCRFSHDIGKYLSTKPPDLGDGKCHVFYEKYGQCPAGVTCRFGSSHIKDSKSVSRAEEDGGVLPLPERKNALDKKTQAILRKKKYKLPAFPRKGESTAEEEITTEEKAVNSEEASNPAPPVEKVSAPFSFLPLEAEPRKIIDFSNKVYVAPLTTVGNLPFRRILKDFGADITCGEMALSQQLLQGQSSEWALFRRHPSEDNYGVQVAGGFSNDMERLAALIETHTSTDFVDLNCGCPIDLVNGKGAGCQLMNKPKRLLDIVRLMMRRLPSRPMTVKMRTGWNDNDPSAHKIVPELQKLSASGGYAPGIGAIFIHGRSRQQRYRSLANWQYVAEAAKAQDPTLPLVPVIGNGDILTWDDWKSHKHLMTTALEDDHAEQLGLCNCAMIGRGALMKPWLPKEIKDQATFDISATERMDMLRRYVDYGLEHWGSDQQGVDNTRRFMLEWLSYLCRYVPSGITESSQTMTERPPLYVGRSDTETLLSSPHASDWIKITEMFLGPVKEGFEFQAKHKSSSYQAAEG